MKINILAASALALSVGFTAAAAAQTSSAADTCILEQLEDVRAVLKNISTDPSFSATATYKGEELAALVKLCEDKTGAKAATLGTARELSVTYKP